MGKFIMIFLSVFLRDHRDDFAKRLFLLKTFMGMIDLYEFKRFLLIVSMIKVAIGKLKKKKRFTLKFVQEVLFSLYNIVMAHEVTIFFNFSSPSLIDH